MVMFLCLPPQLMSQEKSTLTPSNYSLLYNLVRIDTEGLTARTTLMPGDSIEYSMDTTSRSGIAVQDALVEGLKNVGLTVFQQVDSLRRADARLIARLVNVSAHYSDAFRRGFLGEKLTRRTLSAGLSLQLTRNSTGEILMSEQRSLAASDTIAIDLIQEVEREDIPGMRGAPPEDGFFDRVAEPFVIIGATGVAIFLFFHVRS